MNLEEEYKHLDRLQVGGLYRITDYGSVTTLSETDERLYPIEKQSIVMLLGFEKSGSTVRFIVLHGKCKLKIRFGIENLIRWESWLELVK